MFKKHLFLGASLISTALITTPALAQQTDEIIVTATKRTTTLQDTPITVSVTSAEVVEQAQILDILSLQSVVPNFRVSQLQNSANASLIIRGFGNGGNNLGIEPAVGLFVDGVYRSRAGAQIADLPALERIEVLAGPQTTLFGKNASVGVLSVVTEKPQFETQGHVEAGYGNFDSSFGKAYFTTGLTDTVAVSLGASFQERDGLFEPADGTTGGDLNDRDRFALRGQILWEPTEDFSLRLIGDRSELSENCCGTTTAVNATVTTPIVNALGGQLASIELGQAPGDNPSPFSQETALNAGTPNDITDTGISAHIDYDFNDITFTSITALRNNNSAFTSDSDFTSLDILENVFQDADNDTFTQEVRFASNYDGRFNWQIGATYFDETLDINSGIDFGPDVRPFLDALGVAGGVAAAADDAVAAGVAAAADPTDIALATAAATAAATAQAQALAFGTALGDGTFPTFVAENSPLAGVEAVVGTPGQPFFGDQVFINETIRQENESFSIFGTLDFDVTDKFTITVGGNYTDDSKDVTFSQTNNDLFSNLTLTGADGVAVLNAGGVADNFPAVAASCGLGPLEFSPANAGAVIGAPSCFIDTLGNTAPGSAVFAWLQAQVAAGVAALDLTDEAQNPLVPLTDFQFQPNFLDFPNSVEDGSTNDSDFSWSVRGSYEFNDNFTAFASAATGFKASSFNLTRDSRPFVADIAALDAAGLLPNNFSGPDVNNVEFPNGRNVGTRLADPEEITTFEIGLKTRFERGALNIALFDQEVENFQSTLFQGTGFVLANAGLQSTQGIEFDGTFDVAEWLTVTAAGVIQDPVFDDFTGAPVLEGGAIDLADGVEDGVGDLSGQRPAGINSVSLSTSATFKYEFANGVQAFLRGDYQFEDDVQVVDNIEGINRSTNQFNGALGFTFDNGVGVRFWARNITDDRTFTSAFPGVIQNDALNGGAGLGSINAYPNEPRTYGASLRYEFGG